MKQALLLASALLIAAPAVASSPITAGEFLTRAEPLVKKSKAALLFSSEARQLMRLVGDTARANRARLEADRAAGRPVQTCLPPKGKARVDAEGLLAHLRALPAAQRALSFENAFSSYMARKYPCRA